MIHGRPAPAAWGETGFYRLRSGSLRLLYEYDEPSETVTVHAVGIAPGNSTAIGRRSRRCVGGGYRTLAGELG